MNTHLITSVNHPIVKKGVLLRKEASARREHQEAFVSGARLVLDLLKHKKISLLLGTEEGEALHKKNPQVPFLKVTPEILKKMTGLLAPDGVAAFATLPEERKDLRSSGSFFLAIDRIQDPGNLGTLFRSALALGWDGLFLLPGTVDPFNDKVIRAAKGANFFLPFEYTSWNNLKSLKEEKSFHAYVATTSGTSIANLSFQKPLLLVLGNEGEGPSAQACSLGSPISIPMHPDAESLNVSAAGAILLYQIRQMVYT